MYSIDELIKKCKVKIDKNNRVYRSLGSYTLIFHGVLISTDPDNETKEVTFLAPFYVNKTLKLTFCFNKSFSDYDILHDKDVMTKFINSYGVDSLK